MRSKVSERKREVITSNWISRLSQGSHRREKIMKELGVLVLRKRGKVSLDMLYRTLT